MRERERERERENPVLKIHSFQCFHTYLKKYESIYLNKLLFRGFNLIDFVPHELYDA